MKKYIFAFICVCLLTSCGQTEEVPVSENKLEIVHSETITEETTEAASSESTTAVSQAVSTSSSSSSVSVTTTKKIAQAKTAEPKKVQQPKAEVPTQDNTPAESTEAPAETTAAAAQTAPVTEPSTQPPVDATVSPESLNPEISARIVDSGIEIVRNGQVIQKLSADTQSLKASKTIGDPCAIVFNDYDFDGYADVFVPENIGVLNSTGKYFHYDPEKKIYVRWDDMTNISYLAQTNTDNNTVIVATRSNAVDHETKTYSWKNGVLTMIDRKIMYQGSDGAIYNDSFEYNDGIEHLYKRQRDVYDENNVLVSSEEVSIEPIEPTTSEQGE